MTKFILYEAATLIALGLFLAMLFTWTAILLVAS
jgi:hypothetical protein